MAALLLTVLILAVGVGGLVSLGYWIGFTVARAEYRGQTLRMKAALQAASEIEEKLKEADTLREYARELDRKVTEDALKREERAKLALLAVLDAIRANGRDVSHLLKLVDMAEKGDLD